MPPVTALRLETPEAIDPIVDQLLSDGLPEILAQGFEAQGYEAPFIQWSPSLDTLPHPLLSKLARICINLANDGGRVLRSDFLKADTSPLMDWLLVVSVHDHGTSFQYDHYGQGVAGIRGLSMQSKTSDFFSGYISRLFTAVYRACVLRKEWVLTKHQPPRPVFVNEWKRLIVPLFDDDGETVAGMAVGIVPDNDLRIGLDVIPDPVLIADREMVVRYANRAADTTFGKTFQFGVRLDLFEFSGINLVMGEPPETLAASGAVRDQVCLAVGNGILQRFVVTISGMVMRDRSFYVITLRPAF